MACRFARSDSLSLKIEARGVRPLASIFAGKIASEEALDKVSVVDCLLHRADSGFAADSIAAARGIYQASISFLA